MNVRPAAIVVASILITLPSVGAAREKAAPVAPKDNPGRWFPMNSYPPEAKRRGEQGRVNIQLNVDKAGMPTACKVVGSSGSASLDAATCELALANGRFLPARDANGRPVDATYALPGVRWELADDRVLDLSKGGTLMTLSNVQIDVDEQGRGIACRPLDSLTGDIGCNNFLPGTPVSPALSRNGKPIGGKVTMTVTMRVEPK